jgi:branched-chain amino acid transport system permease protein
MSIVVTVALVALLALALDMLCIRFARRKTILSYAMVTIGVGLIYRGGMQIIVGRDIYFPPPLGVISDIKVDNVFIPSQYIWVIISLLTISGFLSYLFLRTRLGKAMRAVSQSPRAAQLCGIEPRFMSALAFTLAGVNASIAGVLIAPIGGAFYENGLAFSLKGFAAAILGGFGSPIGAVIGGLLIGLIESLSAGYLSSGYKDVTSLTILLGLLLVWPSGLLGRVEARRV